MMSNEDHSDDQDDITILHDDLGNPLPPIGSPPDFQFFSEGGVGMSGKAASNLDPQDTAGSSVALKTAYDYVCSQNRQLRKHVKVLGEKNQQMTMLTKATPMAMFHTAAAKDDVERIHEILESGLDINCCNSEGRTALHMAAASGKNIVCRLLLHNKADPIATDNDGKGPIHMACRNGDVENYKILVEFGADMNASDRDGRTPLHIAAANGHPEICRLLIGNGNKVDINERDIYGQTAILMAKNNHHDDVFQLLQDIGAELPQDNLGDGDAASPWQHSGERTSKLQQIIQSLFQILSFLVTKLSVSSELPDLKQRIDRLKLTSQKTLEEGSSESLDELHSIEQTLGDVIELKEWVNHQEMQNSAANVVDDELRDHNAALELKLGEAFSEIDKLQRLFAEECDQKKLLQGQVRSQENQIQRLMSDVENVDLYSATNIEDGREEEDTTLCTYDIAQLFSKVGKLETNSKKLKAEVQNQMTLLKGRRRPHGIPPKQLQDIRLGSSSLPDPPRNHDRNATAPVRQSSSLNENGSARNNYLRMHDIRLPPDMDQPQQVSSSPSNVPTVVSQGQVLLPQSAQQDHRPRHSSTGQILLNSPTRRQDYVRPGHGSWPHAHQAAHTINESSRLSTSEPAKTHESGGARQSTRRSPAFVPRSPSCDVPNQAPFESVKGPPTIEYASQSQTRYVEGASQLHIVEDHIPRRGSGGQTNQPIRVPPSQSSAEVQNMYPVSCSDERSRGGARDQVVVVPGGRHPQEGLWIEQAGGSPRDELATGLERSNQQGLNLGHQSAFVDPQQFTGGRRAPPKTQMECPVCQKVFSSGTTEDVVNTHVNSHFDVDRDNVPGDFEVLQ